MVIINGNILRVVILTSFPLPVALDEITDTCGLFYSKGAGNLFPRENGLKGGKKDGNKENASIRAQKSIKNIKKNLPKSENMLL